MFVHVHFIHVIELKGSGIVFDKMRGQPHFLCLILKTELAPVAYLDSLTWWGINWRAK